MQFGDSLRNSYGLIRHQQIFLCGESLGHCTLITRDSMWDQQILCTVLRLCNDAWVRFVGVLGTVHVQLAYIGDIIFSARIFKFENSGMCYDCS
jgi:hypothetical protein